MFKINEDYFEKSKSRKYSKIKAIFLAGFLLGSLISSGINSCINEYNENIYQKNLESEVYLKEEEF